jgi:hypothetical protein
MCVSDVWMCGFVDACFRLVDMWNVCQMCLSDVFVRCVCQMCVRVECVSDVFVRRACQICATCFANVPLLCSRLPVFSSNHYTV